MKRGQEEIVGFVMIMVIVAVIFLIILGLNVRPNNDSKDSIEVNHFLGSVFETTSDCAVSYIPDYSKLSELFNECLDGRRCLDGRDSCAVLEEDLKFYINKSWAVGSERAIKAYEFSSVYLEKNDSQGKKVVSFASGNCTSNIYGSDFFIRASPGSINARLELCY